MMSKITEKVLLFALLLLVGVGCKSQKEVSEKTNKEERQPMNENSTVRTVGEKGKSYMVDMNNGPQESANATKSTTTTTTTFTDFPDSLVASIQRTACFGECPIYTIKVYQGGYATYEGKRFTKREGLHIGKVSAETIAKITGKAGSINYLGMKDEYDGPVTDLPSTITRINMNGQKKQIKARWKAPEELREYERYIDGLLELVEWAPAPEE